MHAPHSWSQRFMQALPPPSDRAMALFFLVMVFACGVMVGVTWTASREVDRHACEVERLDAVEQRMQALEQRLSPAP